MRGDVRRQYQEVSKSKHQAMAGNGVVEVMGWMDTAFWRRPKINSSQDFGGSSHNFTFSIGMASPCMAFEACVIFRDRGRDCAGAVDMCLDQKRQWA